MTRSSRSSWGNLALVLPVMSSPSPWAMRLSIRSCSWEGSLGLPGAATARGTAASCPVPCPLLRSGCASVDRQHEVHAAQIVALHVAGEDVPAGKEAEGERLRAPDVDLGELTRSD